jgi:uncharacterized protein
LREHGVDFIDMFPLFDGKLVERVDGRYDHGDLHQVFGRDRRPIYVVIYTWRGEGRRIISARKANAREQREYSAGIS